MSKRQVIVLWAIALLLVVTLIAVKSSRQDGFQSATERSRGDTLLTDFEPAEVAELEIRSGETSTTATKVDGSWVIANRDNYPADASAINELLRTLDDVKITQSTESDPSFAPRFGMDPKASEDQDKGVEVVLTNDAGTELAHLTFGKNTEGESNPMNPMGGGGSTGRYVLNHADESGFYTTSELFPTLNPNASEWLADNFVKVEKIKSITASEPGKPDSTAWKLAREDDTKDFTLDGKKDDEEIDNPALSAFKNLLSYAQYEDVIPAADVEAAWQADQKQTAMIETFDGFSYTLTFGPAKDDGDNHLMTVSVEAKIAAEREKKEDETEEAAKTADEAFATSRKALEDKLSTEKKLAGRTYKVSKFTVESLLKKRAEFIKDPNAAPPAAGVPGQGGLPPGFPAGFNPGQGRPRVQAVTPAVSIPPRPAKEGE